LLAVSAVQSPLRDQHRILIDAIAAEVLFGGQRFSEDAAARRSSAARSVKGVKLTTRCESGVSRRS